MRSLLFVPADSDRKLEKSLESGADAVILDLEDSISAAARPAARERARAFISHARGLASPPRLVLRVNGLDSGAIDADLDAVMPAGPDAVMLPKCRTGADVQHLGAKLAVREAEYALPDGATGIIAIATETPAAVFGLGTYAGASHRLLGLAWGAEDLSAALGAEASRTTDGHLTSPFALARDLTLIGARAANAEPIDTVYVDFRDEPGLRAECEAARRDGFTCKLAIHPGQVGIINACFTPTADTLAKAQAVVAAFAAAPDAGVVSIDGAMFDRPHLLRAQRILARATG
jgi:citrate lyase subunit beta/citryl-CoA lyase